MQTIKVTPEIYTTLDLCVHALREEIAAGSISPETREALQRLLSIMPIFETREVEETWAK